MTIRRCLVADLKIQWNEKKIKNISTFQNLQTTDDQKFQEIFRIGLYFQHSF